jgi:lipopolysaccharide export system protein LptA
MRRWSAMGGLAAVIAGLSCRALPAAAQVNTRSNAPIDITANEAEVINSKCLAIWRGEAEALQGDARLRANTISVYSQPKGTNADGQPSCGGTDRIEAEGSVFYVTPQRSARGDRAVYSEGADRIVITGNVIVVQGNDVARGDRLTIKISTREAKLESNLTGAGAPHRVRGVFYPAKNGDSATTPARSGAAAAPAAPGTPTP